MKYYILISFDRDVFAPQNCSVWFSNKFLLSGKSVNDKYLLNHPTAISDFLQTSMDLRMLLRVKSDAKSKVFSMIDTTISRYVNWSIRQLVA
jgi:hypothetical protein